MYINYYISNIYYYYYHYMYILYIKWSYAQIGCIFMMWPKGNIPTPSPQKAAYRT